VRSKPVITQLTNTVRQHLRCPLFKPPRHLRPSCSFNLIYLLPTRPR